MKRMKGARRVREGGGRMEECSFPTGKTTWVG